MSGVAVAVAAGGFTRPLGGDVVLRFGVVYRTADRQKTHRGIDIEGNAGESVLAAADGVVTFAGEVPADVGGRTNAVTIRTAEGLLVCVMPLERTCVGTGDTVSASSRLGELAASGDASSPGGHVHLSVRENGAYIDPEPLFECAPGASVSTDVGGSGTQASEAGETAVGGSTSLCPARTRRAAAAFTRSAPVASPCGAAPALSARQTEALRDAFSAEVSRLRSSRGRLNAIGFAEPSLADLTVAAVRRSAAVPPVESAGIGLVGASVLALAVVLGRRRAPSSVGAQERA
ncbi:MAG: M23 family metallopeptidase [Actinomycetia bacterium]|nr:M23 family metallopeptidase [Actinomycetes bacterium]